MRWIKVMVRDLGNEGYESLQETSEALARAGSQAPGIVGMISGFRASTPQMFVEVDRQKCRAIGVPLNEVFLALQLYLGGYYTNDFNEFGRAWQVNLQADPDFRISPEDVRRLKVRNQRGEMVSIGTIANVVPSSGPAAVTRYNGATAAAINGASFPGVSSGDVIRIVESLASNELTTSNDLQWTELTLLQIRAGNTAMLVFALAVVLVFLVLSAQYESWSLPLAVILVVPMCLLSSVIGVALARMDINIFVQIGLVVLVGLASKNAILIVEFAKGQVEGGASLIDATVQACRMRLRPIMMTSFAFILGVVPLAMATGAGARNASHLRHRGVFRMLVVTLFGIFLTPVFFYLVMRVVSKR